MNRLLSLLLALPFLSALAKDPAPAPPLAVEIVPGENIRGEQAVHRWDRISGFPALDVVLTNTSSKPVTVWRDNNSWGYGCLSFEAEVNGKRIAIKRIDVGGDSNGPVPFMIRPGHHFVLHVSSTDEDKSWPSDWIPKSTGNPVKFKLRAIYSISRPPGPDDIGVRQFPEVWQGTATSPFEEYELRDTVFGSAPISSN